jgi:hypothetical protein
MLGIAAIFLAPDDPASLLILAALAAIRIWRTGDAMEMEGSDFPCSIGHSQTDQQNIFRDCDLT